MRSALEASRKCSEFLGLLCDVEIDWFGMLKNEIHAFHAKIHFNRLDDDGGGKIEALLLPGFDLTNDELDKVRLATSFDYIGW